MIRPNIDELTKQLNQARLKVAGKSYLYVDECDTCGAPIVKSYQQGRPRSMCKECVEAAKVARKWARKQARIEQLTQ